MDLDVKKSDIRILPCKIWCGIAMHLIYGGQKITYLFGF